MADEEGVVALNFASWAHGSFSGNIYWKIVGGKLTAWVIKDPDNPVAEAVALTNIFYTRIPQTQEENKVEYSLKKFSININTLTNKGSKYTPYTAGKEFINIDLTEPGAIITDSQLTAKRKINEIDVYQLTYKGTDRESIIKIQSSKKELPFIEPLKPKSS
ncbi:MAG: hypothetical protein K0R49_1432 [Burkholderiales bacterium]|nr:hypothetical protein [Burkholderiales bacterium]